MKVKSNTGISVSRRTILKAMAVGAAVPSVARESARPQQQAKWKTSGGASGPLQFLMISPTPKLKSAFTDDLLPRFKKAHGVEVQITTVGSAASFQYLLTASAAGTVPDVIPVEGIWTAPLASKGGLMKLDKYVTHWKPKTQFYPGPWSDGEWNGHVYAIPYNQNPRALVYRKDFFQSAGLDPSKPPKTWAEMQSYAEKLVTRSGSQITREGMDWGLDGAIGLQQAFAQLYLESGGSYYKRNGKANFSSHAGQQALDYLVSYYSKGLSSVNVVTLASSPPALVSGAAAMTYTNASVFAQAAVQNKAVLPQLAVAPPPTPPNQKHPVPVTFTNKYAISRTTKAPEAAWQFLQFLVSPDNLAPILASQGTFPPRRDMAHESYLNSFPTEWLQLLPTAVSQPQNPAMLQITTKIESILEQAVRKQVPVRQALSSIDSTVNQLTGK